MEATIEAAWNAVSMALRVSSHSSGHWLRTIVQRYSEPQRHYHTLKHVHSLLALSSRYATRLQNHDAVVLAVFFHEYAQPNHPHWSRHEYGAKWWMELSRTLTNAA